MENEILSLTTLSSPKQEPDVPPEAQYLKVIYPGEYPALPADLSGRSFKRVFGTTQSGMELFLLKRDLMGPCWLKISVIFYFND